MILKTTILLATLTSFAHLSSSAPSTTPSCITAIAFPNLDPVCTPIKAGSTSVNPPPKFLFSSGNYCATFDAAFPGLGYVLDDVPAGKTCSITTYQSANCQGNSKTTEVGPGGCITIGLSPVAVSGVSQTAISARLTCV